MSDAHRLNMEAYLDAHRRHQELTEKVRQLEQQRAIAWNDKSIAWERACRAPYGVYIFTDGPEHQQRIAITHTGPTMPDPVPVR